MTFKISPGLYVLSSEISDATDYRGSPIALVGSFRRGSLKPSRINAENSHLYDLDNQNLSYGYSTIIARQVSNTRDLVIKRVVHKNAKSSNQSFFKNGHNEFYAQLHYDEDGNLLYPVAIFFNSEITEDYKVLISIKTSDGFTCSAEAKYATSHNDTVVSLVEQLKEQLLSHNKNFIVEYNNLADTIPAILIYPAFGYSIDGSVQVILDLVPYTLAQKVAILDQYVSNYRINPDDRARVVVLLDNNTFYKDKEVEAFLNDYIKENYLSKTAVSDRLNYYVAQKELRGKDLEYFFNFTNGREQSLHNFEELDALIESFKKSFYMTKKQIIDYTESLVGTIITEASVQILSDTVYTDANWLYANEVELRATILEWANAHLVSLSTKKAWVNQYIAQSRIRANDYDDALSKIDVPTDDIIGVQRNLDKYCTDTYLSQEEKNAIIQKAVDDGLIQQSDFDNVVRLTSYLIRKDESELMTTAISLYASSKLLTTAQISDWVNSKVSSGYLLLEDRQDFEDFLVNDPVYKYVYHSTNELEDKYNEYAELNYVSTAYAKTYVNSFVGTTITQEDADEITESFHNQVIRMSTVSTLINNAASKYLTIDEIQEHIERSFIIDSSDLPAVMSLFTGKLIIDIIDVDRAVENWISQNYMSEDDFIANAHNYDENQTANAIVILSEDIQAFAQAEHTSNPSVHKTDTLSFYNILVNWSNSYYIPKATLQSTFITIATERDFDTTAYSAFAASSYCHYELYTSEEKLEADINSYITDYYKTMVADYVASNYSGHDLEQVIVGRAIVSDGTVVDGEPSGEELEAPMLSEGVDQDGNILYKTFSSFEEAEDIMKLIGTTYLSFDTYDATLTANAKYNALSEDDKKIVFSLSWYSRMPEDVDEPEDFQDLIFYKNTTDLGKVIDYLCDNLSDYRPDPPEPEPDPEEPETEGA